MTIYIEPFAGSAAVALQLVGGCRVVPPIGYMGGKRRLADDILGAAGLHPGDGADLVVLIDAGPWGEAWEVIFDVERRPALVACLRSWRGEDPSALWERLRDAGRPEDPVERVAAWLWLQGRAANNSPVWWEESAPVMPGGSSRGATMPAQEQHGPRLIMPEKMNRGEPLKDAVERSRKAAGVSYEQWNTPEYRGYADEVQRLWASCKASGLLGQPQPWFTAQRAPSATC